MSDNLTLDQVTPRKTLRTRGFLGVVILVLLAILAATYVQTEIDPIKLYNKRSNAWSYLFGRDLQGFDLNDARSQAERIPQVMAREEARQELRTMEAAGRTFPAWSGNGPLNVWPEQNLRLCPTRNAPPWSRRNMNGS